MKMLKPKLKMLKQTLPGLREGRFADRNRGNRHERGYGTAWERLRKTILDRDGGLCQVCKAAGHITLANAVDHITPKAHGGTDDPSNLQSICLPCHGAKTAREAAG